MKAEGFHVKYNQQAGWELLLPSLGQPYQEINNLANPNPNPNTNFSPSLPKALTPAELDALNQYIIPQWQKLHNKLCQQMKALNAMPTKGRNQEGALEYLDIADFQEWVNFVTPPQLTIPTV